MFLLTSSFHPFFFQCYGHHPDLHSFPTRRSSDLRGLLDDFRAGRVDADHLGGRVPVLVLEGGLDQFLDRKSTRLNSSHLGISYAVFCLKKKKKKKINY